ncbi:hypothetical protein THAOC_34640, partial [Thalassiosira oceanica]
MELLRGRDLTPREGDDGRFFTKSSPPKPVRHREPITARERTLLARLRCAAADADWTGRAGWRQSSPEPEISSQRTAGVPDSPRLAEASVGRGQKTKALDLLDKAAGHWRRRPRRAMTKKALPVLLLLLIRPGKVSCFAPTSARRGVALQQSSSKNLNRYVSGCSPRRQSTHLLDKSDDDSEDLDSPAPFENDLDIFGQPKSGKPHKQSRFFEDDGDIRGDDRLKSCIPYLLPLIDGDQFGHYIYQRFGLLGDLDYVILRPFVELGFTFSFLLFLTFSIGPRFFGNLSREVRFNAQQAVLIDVALLLPQILAESVEEVSLPRTVVEPCSNFVYIALVVTLDYTASGMSGLSSPRYNKGHAGTPRL